MILITGCAGFIGFHVANEFLKQGFEVLGVDSLNKYYDKKLKLSRLKILQNHINFNFKKIDLIKKFDFNIKIDAIFHFAAQPGVRYTKVDPKSYVTNNILATFNLLEFSKNKKIKYFILASSSSVYGLNKKKIFKEDLLTNTPTQIYSASKISNESMLHCYSYLNNMKSVALRFFSVYGPWGRPDMAVFKFTDLISKNKKIELYNKGNNLRDYTYISDIVDGIVNSYSFLKKTKKHFEVFNLGNSSSHTTISLLKKLEKNLNRKAKITFSKNLKEDLNSTLSDITKSKNKLNYKPKIKEICRMV